VHPPHPGLCAGKRSVASFLVDVLEFTEVVLAEEQSDGDATPDPVGPGPSVIAFSDVEDLMEHITPRWTERFVLTGVKDKKVLDELSIRPFFILMSVDAPVYVRWTRYQQRSEPIVRSSVEPDSLKRIYLQERAYWRGAITVPRGVPPSFGQPNV